MNREYGMLVEWSCQSEIVKTYADRADVPKLMHVATMAEIEDNGWNLNIPRYVDTFEGEEMVDLTAAKAELKEIVEKKQAAIDKAERFLKELGV